jgi:SAM-dependent methyltransferase
MSSSADTPGAHAARDMWEQRYGGDGYVYGTEPNGYLRECLPTLPLRPGSRVLCLAEGEGRNAVFLAQAGHEVHSVDLTETGVAKTLRLAADRGVQVHAVTVDLAEHDLGVGQWDLIVSIFAHMPPKVRAGLHGRVTTALRPGGTLLLEAYTPAQIGRGTGGPALVEMTMTLAGLREELAGLHFAHALETERDVVEGSGHSGVGAVVQVLAHKPA